MRIFLIFLLGLLPQIALAKPAIVRSGEHVEFSRLVVYLPEGQKWSLETSGDGAVLKVEEWADGFDIATVFSRIPKTRISELSSGDNALSLTLDCECTVTAEELLNGPVVIDVSGDPDTNPIQPETPEGAEDAAALTKTADLPEQKDDVPPLGVANDTPSENVATAQKSPDTTANEDVLRDFRKALARQVGNAASQSLLTLSDQFDVPDIHSKRPEASKPPDDEPETPPLSTELASSPQIRVRDGAIEAHFKDHGRSSEHQVQKCIAERDVDIASWGDARPFVQQLGAVRSELFGEFDTINEAASIKLAQLYLFFGLSAEARLTINTLASDAKGGTEIVALTDVLEGINPSTNPLRTQHHCGQHARFWAYLSDPTDEVDESDVEDLVSVFSGLPIEVREIIAPRLILAFSEAGLTTAAEVVRADVTRTDPSLAPVIAIAVGDPAADMAQEDLYAVLETNDENSPGALIAILERHLEDGGKIPVDLLPIADAFLRETEGGPEYENLVHVSAKAKARGGAFEDAFATALLSERDSEMMRQLHGTLVGELVDRGTPREIATIGLQLMAAGILETLPLEVVEPLVSRLLTLGLPAVANELASAIGTTKLSAAIKAEMAAALGDARNSAQILANPAVPEVTRATLALAIGQSRAFLERGGPISGELRDRVLWESGAFEQYDRDDARGRAVRVFKAEGNVESSDAPISAAERLTANSQTARQTLRELLDVGKT